MNLLTKVEWVAEFIITYLFRGSAGAIQPVQVARELLKAMHKNKQVSISNVYVPNVYQVELNPRDFMILESFGETFLIELARHLYDQGVKQGYTFLTLPVVEIAPAESILSGTAGIKIAFDDEAVAKWQIEDENTDTQAEDIENTTVLVDSVRLTRLNATDPGRKFRSYLEVIKGDDEGKIFYLEQDDLTLGRHQDCDIEIQDVEISRKHLRLYTEDRRWFIQDLGSTNGTFVNKLRVDRYMVNPGDKIVAGKTQFRFNVEK